MLSSDYFLENGDEFADDERAPYAVLPAPYERAVSFSRGTGAGPLAILDASIQLELFDEELSRAPELRVQTLTAPDCQTGGAAEILARIGNAAAAELSAGRFLMTLGGEHSISAPLIAAAARTYPDITVLHLDAHLDLRDSYLGSPLSHASVMRRVMETGVPIVHVGIRSLCAEEYELIRARNLPVFWARDIVGANNDGWIEQIAARLGRRVYVSLDVDVLDPGIMPGTGTPEPGGLTYRAITRLLREICRCRTVVAADLVETAPIPGTVVSEYTAACLTAKLLAYHKLEGLHA